MMAVSDLQIVVNTLLYFSIFLCGFVISIPLGVANVSKEKVSVSFLKFCSNALKKRKCKIRYVYARCISCCININTSVKNI